MRLVTLISMFTRIQFIVFRVIFLFFPAMTMITMILIRTALSIVIDVGSRSPIITLLFWIVIQLRFSAEILPIMRVYTLVSQMICFIIRAPYSFEVEHIEIWILLEFINQLNRDLGFIVSKWAVLSILAFPSTIDIWRAKLSFVLIRVIKLFYSIMCLLTCVTIRAFLPF